MSFRNQKCWYESIIQKFRFLLLFMTFYFIKILIKCTNIIYMFLGNLFPEDICFWQLLQWGAISMWFIPGVTLVNSLIPHHQTKLWVVSVNLYVLWNCESPSVDLSIIMMGNQSCFKIHTVSTLQSRAQVVSGPVADAWLPHWVS